MNSQDKVRWGIIGPGSIAHNFAQGIAEAKNAELVAVASRSSERSNAFGERFGVETAHRHESYEALYDDPDVDAVYIATPHPFHAEQALAAIRAGKHVAVEKPAAVTADDVTRIVEAAGSRNVFLMEAYMYLHHPQIRRLIELLKEGNLGEPLHVRARFGFAAPFDPASRLYSPDLAGGGILDVGGYPLTFARLVAGLGNSDFATPSQIDGMGTIGSTGVDISAFAHLKFLSGMTAEIAAAVALDLCESAEVVCENGRVTLADPWVPGKAAGPSDADIVWQVGGEEPVTERIAAPKILYAYEVEAAGAAISDGKTALSYPLIDPHSSIGNAVWLTRWRDCLSNGA